MAIRTIRTDDFYESGALLPGPGAILSGPTFEKWLDATLRRVSPSSRARSRGRGWPTR